MKDEAQEIKRKIQNDRSRLINKQIKEERKPAGQKNG